MATVLIVDDDRSIRDLLRLALHFDGHYVASAATVNEAIAAVEENPPQFVVIDGHLPQRGGIEFCRLRLDGALDARVLMWSGDADLREEALAAGADVFLVKGGPSFDEIRRLIKAGPVPARERAQVG